VAKDFEIGAGEKEGELVRPEVGVLRGEGSQKVR